MKSEITKFDFIDYFAKKLIGFENQTPKYVKIDESNFEYLMVVMDKVARLEGKSGRLRLRVWSHCYFIFHDGVYQSYESVIERIKSIRAKYPYLFIRSYIYFVFIDISEKNKNNLFNDNEDISLSDYKIWLFNSKYEIIKKASKDNLFEPKLYDGETIDDIMYMANPISELARIRSANSDVIDCIRAFTGDLELLEQTITIMSEVDAILDKDPKARILLEGPARSGKTVIAASILGKHENSKFLLMNYYFYNAIVDGLHALDKWSKEEIEQLVKNPELDRILEWQSHLKRHFEDVLTSLNSVLAEMDHPDSQSTSLDSILIIMKSPENQENAKERLVNALKDLFVGFNEFKVDFRDFASINALYDFYLELCKSIPDCNGTEIGRDKIVKAIELVRNIVNNDAKDLIEFENAILDAIAVIMKDSKQKFFHHNINKRFTEGCWLKRGSPTVSRLWSSSFSTSLLICDEVQRLGVIDKFLTYDRFDEIDQIVAHTNQAFFTGDDYQKLNCFYDKGISELKNEIQSKGQTLYTFKLPEAVGIPAEIGLLMKYLTNPGSISIETIAKSMQNTKIFDIQVLYRGQERLVDIFDKDESIKKHFAAPMDSRWNSGNMQVLIHSSKREKPIIAIRDHPIDDFAYKYPYFCNEEIMPNYILSAYELISREVESLYVHIPINSDFYSDQWYKNHMYVLFT